MSATQQVSAFIVRPQVIPATEPITQVELTLLLSLRGRLHQLEAQVANAEGSIKLRLQQGAGVEIAITLPRYIPLSAETLAGGP